MASIPHNRLWPVGLATTRIWKGIMSCLCRERLLPNLVVFTWQRTGIFFGMWTMAHEQSWPDHGFLGLWFLSKGRIYDHTIFSMVDIMILRIKEYLLIIISKNISFFYTTTQSWKCKWVSFQGYRRFSWTLCENGKTNKENKVGRPMPESVKIWIWANH